MARMVKCVKLGKEAEGLDYPTYPGELGKRIFENVSKEAWKTWLGHQTMLMNENRLSPLDPKARKFLEAEMENISSAKARSCRPVTCRRPANKRYRDNPVRRTGVLFSRPPSAPANLYKPRELPL